MSRPCQGYEAPARRVQGVDLRAASHYCVVRMRSDADAPPEVRRILGRVAALDLGAVIAAPTGDRGSALACLERWWRIVRALVDADGTVLRALRAIDGEAAAFVEFIERRYPSPPLPAACTLAWAECPLALLVDPAVPGHAESEDCYGYYRGGLTWSAAPAVERLATALLRAGGEGHPYRGLPLRIDDPGASVCARARFAREMLVQVARGIVDDVVTFALLHPTFAENPHEVELELLEHGLFPLGVDDHGACRVFRPAPAPVVVPTWLPHFTPAG